MTLPVDPTALTALAEMEQLNARYEKAESPAMVHAELVALGLAARRYLATLRSLASLETPAPEGQTEIARLTLELDEARRVANFAHLFKKAANDPNLSDLEARNVARFLSLDPVTEKDIARAQELAAQYGWQ